MEDGGRRRGRGEQVSERRLGKKGRHERELEEGGGHRR